MLSFFTVSFNLVVSCLPRGAEEDEEGGLEVGGDKEEEIGEVDVILHGTSSSNNPTCELGLIIIQQAFFSPGANVPFSGITSTAEGLRLEEKEEKRIEGIEDHEKEAE